MKLQEEQTSLYNTGGCRNTHGSAFIYVEAGANGLIFYGKFQHLATGT